MKFNFTCSTFKTIGKELTQMTLGDIKPNSSWVGGADMLKTLTQGGGIDKTYTYMNAADAKEWGFTEGWYYIDEYLDDQLDLTDRCHNSDIIPFAQCFAVNVGSPATKLVYAGEVHGEDQPLSLTGNMKFNFVGNASPVNLTLGDIRPNANWVGGADMLKTLTQGGGIDKTYTYMNAKDAEDWGFTEGWYYIDEYLDDQLDLSDKNRNSTPIPAGQGFAVNVGSPATSVIIPTAL